MDLAADDAPAARTGLALAIIDRKGVLELTELAGGADMVAQRRTAGGDGLVENLADRHRQTLGGSAVGLPVRVASEPAARSGDRRARHSASHT